MNTTQPIRDKKQLHDFKEYYASQAQDKPNALRNQTLIILGLNTALRISDILRLTWNDVFDGKKVKKHIVIREQKTGKENHILINAEAKNILLKYFRSQLRKNKKSQENQETQQNSQDSNKSRTAPKKQNSQQKQTAQKNKKAQKPQTPAEMGNSYLFPSPKKEGGHLSRYQAHRIISHAAKELHMEHVSCHSLRKTFGYHAWKQGVQPALLMSIFNHSSWQITMRYLGITQDEKDKVFAKIVL